jgi:hypothetical protein
LLGDYQAEPITHPELQPQRQKLSAKSRHTEQEFLRLSSAQQQSIHRLQVIDNAETFDKLLGDNLGRLSSEERQAAARCLIIKVTVTGEEVDITSPSLLIQPLRPSIAPRENLRGSRSFLSVAPGRSRAGHYADNFEGRLFFAETEFAPGQGFSGAGLALSIRTRRRP